MALIKIQVKESNPELDQLLLASDHKKSLVKQYIEENKTLNGIEEATGIKFTKPVKLKR